MTDNFSLGGNILKVNLSSRQISQEATSDYSDRAMGGLGVNLLKLLEELKRGVSAFDPENVIAFGAGVLVGTIAPGASRTCVTSKNLFSGGLGSASAGGFFSSELKYAGFDNVVVKGKAKNPVYIYINDKDVSIEDASFLWGRSTFETEDLLREKIGDKNVRILSIGPAGENLSGSACVIVSRSRSASRCGLGAVMGSKNLKAIVVKGTGGIEVADPEGFMEACLEMTQRMQQTSTVKKLFEYGTPVSFEKWNAQSALPINNFQLTQMDLNISKNLHAENLKKRHIEKSFSCFSCPIPCSNYNTIKDGPYAGRVGEKIECQHLWDFGTKLGIDNLPAILEASRVCTELGLDINNATGAISWAFECFQRGILTEKDTDGLQLNWSNAEVIIKLLRKIAFREGFGDLLAKGSLEAAKIIGRGSEKYCMQIKGQELAEELRAFKGWALGVTVSERGTGHTMGAPLTERMDISASLSKKLFGVSTASDPDTYEGKAQLVVYYQRLHAVLEALGMCHFTSNWMGPQMLGPDDYAVLYNLATGNKLTEAELMMKGEKIHNLSKIFNVRHACLSRKDDFPPERLLNEPTTGTVKGLRLDKTKWEAMLTEYYDLHGWDRETGCPQKDTLVKLGLNEFVDFL
jgi:aldehyde:ferredoxin oxidoreductase